MNFLILLLVVSLYSRDLESEIADLLHERGQPFLELLFRLDVDAAGGDNKIIDHKIRLPCLDFVPSIPPSRSPQRSSLNSLDSWLAFVSTLTRSGAPSAPSSTRVRWSKPGLF